VQILSILILVFVMTSTLPSSVYTSAEEPTFASMYDVVVFDSSCFNSTSCIGERVEHLVEYYGADWCEPCELIEDEIDVLNRTDTFVIQHHPSVVDDSFLSASKLRFENEHRLLFLPSLVIDGQGLLTGSSQGLELSNTLSQRSTSYSGLSEVELNNGSLTWQASQGDRVSVWRTEAMEHPDRNRTHPTLATGMMQFNASNESGNISSLLENFNGSLVVILEQAGTYRLVSDSTNTASGVELYDDSDMGQLIGTQGMSPGQRASLWTGILLAALAPAMYMRWNLSKQVTDEGEWVAESD
jgi:hypothetical protein